MTTPITYPDGTVVRDALGNPVLLGELYAYSTIVSKMTGATYTHIGRAAKLTPAGRVTSAREWLRRYGGSLRAPTYTGAITHEEKITAISEWPGMLYPIDPSIVEGV